MKTTEGVEKIGKVLWTKTPFSNLFGLGWARPVILRKVIRWQKLQNSQQTE